MFPPPKTPEEKAEAAAEAAAEAEMYQQAIAEMEPYLVNGKQVMVNENGEEPREGNDYSYPVWKNKDGLLMARVYSAGWDWLFPEMPEEDEEYD
jgi:hypothetical protein